MEKVLFAAAEAVPFAKTGGLGDVIGSLPKELIKQGIDVRVILPKYQDIPEKFKEQMVQKATCTVEVGWRQQYCGIQYLEYDGVPFYFVDNEYYFKRHGFYGYHDDAERFSFFCRAVLEVLPLIDFMPDVIHAHDWHTGMISVFKHANYQYSPEYAQMKTLFTIHNLRYQGVFPKEIMNDLLALDWGYFNPDGLEFNDAVNFMKGGLAYSNMISTVSRTYAHEIQMPYFGEHLDGLLRAREQDLIGIVNGIDYDIYNPEKDELIFSNYSGDDFTKKAENKTQLQQKLGLQVRDDVPLIAIVSRLVGPKGMDLVEYIFHDLVKQMLVAGNDSLDFQLVVLGTGEARYENLFKYVAWQYPGKVAANILFDDALAHQIYAASDIFLMPSLYEPCGIGQLIAMRYGTLPLVRETGGLKDTVIPFNKYTGEGTGFSFTNYNAHEMFDTFKNAVNLYTSDKTTWEKLVKKAMVSDYSWQESARQYGAVYKKLIG